MAKTKIKRRRSTATARTNTAATNKEEGMKREEMGNKLEALVPQLTLAITSSLRFLSSNDLLLLPSQSLSLSSLLRSSALSLSSLLNSPSLLPIPPPPSPPSSSSTLKFPWFRRFLASSSSPSDPRWLSTFRMSKPSFYLLLQTLSPTLSSISSSSSPVPPDHKLGAALFRLAHAAPFSFVARHFGLPSAAFAARSFYETVRSLTLHLNHLFELSSDLPRILHSFSWLSLPNCSGALSFSRFPIVSSSGGSFRGRSVLGQFLVDSEGRFLDVSVGWHGSMTPAQILIKTKLFASQNVVLGDDRGANLERRYFIGGSCCPLQPWLLTPYKDVECMPSSSKEVVFNTVHARGMELAERAFVTLRTRWRLLNMEWKEECVEALPYIVVASCLLHNYLIRCNEPVVTADEMEGCWMESGFVDFEGEGEGDEGGVRIRDLLAENLSYR